MENVVRVTNIKVVYLENYNGGDRNEQLHYKHEGDSGFDLRAGIKEPVTLSPLERKIIPSGCKFVIPEGQELQVRPRGGTSLRGLSVVNTPGTVDSCFRGEVGILAINLSVEPITIEPGERIAQGVIAPVTKANLVVTTEKELDETTRGSGAYNSTGKG